MRHIINLLRSRTHSCGVYLLVLSSYLLLPSPSWAQRPCRDTVVHFSDSICQGGVYHWAGRDLTYSGVFYDTLTRARDTCDSISILHLYVFPPIDLALYYIPICRGKTGYEIVTTFYGNHQWWSSDPPDPDFTITQPPNYAYANPARPTVYTVHADYSATPFCPDSAHITVNPLQPVKAALTAFPSSLDYDHPRLTLHDASTGNRSTLYGGWAGRHWYIDSVRLNYWEPDITVDISDPYPDSVHIRLEAYSPTCGDQAVAVVPFNKDLIAIPDVFTPGADNNNRFLPHIQNVAEYHIYIYNRLGRLVFDTTDPTLPWDGTHQGHPQPQGTYNYRIIYSHTYSPAERHTLAGTVTLLR